MRIDKEGNIINDYSLKVKAYKEYIKQLKKNKIQKINSRL